MVQIVWKGWQLASLALCLFAGSSASFPQNRRSVTQEVLQKLQSEIHSSPSANLGGEGPIAGDGVGSIKCIPDSVRDLPGVGFELGLDYATVAIKYENGTVIDVGKIRDRAYSRVMHKFSRPPRPLPWPLAMLRAKMSQALRTIRLTACLVPTPEIKVMSRTLKDLSLLASPHLQQRVKYAVASFPSSNRMPAADLKDTFAIAGIGYTESPKYLPEKVDILDAVYAGMGYGLCASWDDFEKCDEQEDAMGEKFTLAVGYDDEGLTVSMALMSDAYHRVPLFSKTNSALGNGLASSESLGDVLSDLLIIEADAGSKKAYRVIDEVLLYGEHALDPAFQREFLKALEGLDGKGDLRGGATATFVKFQTRNFAPDFVAARGAAELARRWQIEKWGAGSQFCSPSEIQVVEAVELVGPKTKETGPQLPR